MERICGNCKYYNEHIANRKYKTLRLCERTYIEDPHYSEWVFYSSHPCEQWEKRNANHTGEN